jgi:transcriptional antiterminator RfaH
MFHWYALRSKPRRELAVAALLERVGIETYVPRTPGGRPRETDARSQPFFPGYCFSRLDSRLGHLRLVRYTTGVLHIVGYGDEPWPVPDALINTIRERLEQEQPPVVAYQPGEAVVIATGPLREATAIFDRHLSATGRARVLITLLERLCRAEVPIEHLRRPGQTVDLVGNAR